MSKSPLAREYQWGAEELTEALGAAALQGDGQMAVGVTQKL